MFVGVINTWGEVIYAPLIGVYITPTVYSMYETGHACIKECSHYSQGAFRHLTSQENNVY